MVEIHILTLFPEMFKGPFDASIVRRAIDRGLVSISIHNIRDYATDRHRVVDDYPFGGGPGMVLKPEPVFEAVEAIEGGGGGLPVILLTPQGRLFDTGIAQELTGHDRLVLICGHYEGGG